MLFRFELKKLLLTKRGIAILLICLFLKAVFLFAFPEQIDDRIRLSRKQYDKYLDRFYGEDTEEKSARIKEEYIACETTISSMGIMMEEYQTGKMAEEEWRTFTDDYNDAYLHINSLEIFYEKAIQFGELEASYQICKKPCYIDESGWQTVYTLLKFPDVFLLIFIMIMSIQAFSSEESSGMLPVLMSSSRGREELYSIKVCVLVVMCFLSLAAGSLIEFLIFHLRGFLKDGDAPLYSITIFSKTYYKASLLQGFVRCLMVRCIIMTAFSLIVLGLSVWIRSSVNLIILSLLLLLLPLLFLRSKAAIFTHSILLSGTWMLILSSAFQIPVWFSAAIVTILSLLVMLCGMRKLVT